METRKEKYAKYREEIKMTSPEAFPTSSSDQAASFDPEDDAVLQSVDYSANAISCGSILAPLEQKKKDEGDSLSPYERYLTKRRRALFVKIILFAIAIVALIVWFLIMQKGR